MSVEVLCLLPGYTGKLGFVEVTSRGRFLFEPFEKKASDDLGEKWHAVARCDLARGALLL